MLTFDLAAETDALRSEEGWRSTGHNAKTLAKYQDMAIVLISMKRYTRMEDHRADGAVSIHVLAGHIRLHVGGKTIDLLAGSLLALDRALGHDVEALDDSAFVLTVSRLSHRRRR